MMRFKRWREISAATVCGLAAAMACGSGSTAGTDSGTGHQVPDQGLDATTDHETGAPPTSEMNCGSTSFRLVRSPVDLLVLLDNSGAMANDIDNASCPAGCGSDSKWALITMAISRLVAETSASIHWGLRMFTDDGSCAVSPNVAVPIGEANGQAIADAIALTTPGGGAPTPAAERAGVGYLQTLTDPNPKFILLATGGLPTCALGDPGAASVDETGAKQAVADALAMGISTFVLGVAGASDPATMTLNQLAANGGHPRNGPLQYYPVSNATDLLAALSQSVELPGCVFPLAPIPPHTANLLVTVNGVTVPRDATNGWTFDPGTTSITFNGSSCESVLSSETLAVQVLYGCTD